MIARIKRWLGWGRPQERHCRECGAVVPRGDALCPHCHGMDIDDGRRSAYQEAAAERAGGGS